MPIIEAVDGSLTKTESTSIAGRTTDGVVALFTGDHLTCGEARGAAVVSALVGGGVSSVYARKRMAAGKKPFMGVFL